MKIQVSGLIFFLLIGCSTFSYHPSNVEDYKVAKINPGMDYSEFKKIVSKNPFDEEYLDDGGKWEYYTADYNNGSLIWCRTLAIKSHNGKIIQKVFVNAATSNQSRCDMYSAASHANSAAWTNGFNEMGQSLNTYQQQRSISTQRKFCYYGEFSNSGTCFSSLGECQQAVRVYNGGACTIE